MRLKILILLITIACATGARAQTSAPKWYDATRDIYIDGELDRNAQVIQLDSPRRIAVLSPKLARAAIVDTADGTVKSTPRESFRFASDRASATLDAGAVLETAGKYTRIDNYTYLLSSDGKTIFFRTHTGATGQMTEQKLLETVPVWRSLMEEYKPDAEAVAAIKASDREADVTVVYGTWCPDSKNHVPRLLKALQVAGSSRLRVKLIGIDNQFNEPINIVQALRIINVPTVIVERDGGEVGRFVETPASKSIEEDLAAILNGKPKTHPGKWDRGPEVARGTYEYRDSGGKARGTERWRLYSTSEGGFLLHSEIAEGDLTTEVFHRVNALRRPTFVEITRRRGGDLARGRYTLNGQTLSVRMRGNLSGVIQQTLEVPASILFSSPALAAEGWNWAQASNGNNRKQGAIYIAPRAIDKTVGTLGAASFELKGEEIVRVLGQEVRASHIVTKAGAESGDWWMHPELGIPVCGRAGGVEYVLTSLEVSGKGK